MKLTEKLNAIQAQLKAPKDKKNSFGGYNYRSCESILEAVKPLLQAQSCILTISDEIVEIGNRIYVRAKATISDGEGEYTTYGFAREPESKKGMDEPQVTGTASSYARKYALNGLFAIDDTKDADTDEYAKETGRTAKSQLRRRGKQHRKHLQCHLIAQSAASRLWAKRSTDIRILA